MSAKLILYCFALPITIWAIESLDLNRFFKKGRVFQAQLLYFIISLGLSYLFVNFCYDVFLSSKILI